MNGAEVYTVVCLPPTVAGKLGSVTALDFATKLRLAAFQPTQQPGRPSSVMGRLDSRPVSDVLGEHRNGDRNAQAGGQDDIIRQLLKKISDLESTVSQMVVQTGEQTEAINTLSARVRLLELANRPQPRPRLDFSSQTSSTPVSRTSPAPPHTPSGLLDPHASFDSSLQLSQTSHRFGAPGKVYRDLENENSQSRHF